MASPSDAQKARARRLQAQVDRMTQGASSNAKRQPPSPRQATDEAAAEKRKGSVPQPNPGTPPPAPKKSRP